MGSSTIPVPASTAGGATSWTLVANTVPAGSVGTYTYSSLSGYKVYKVIYRVVAGSTATLSFTVNGSTSYSWGAIGAATGTAAQATTTASSGTISANGTITAAATGAGVLIIDNADKTIAKDFKFSAINTGSNYEISGAIDTGAITSITIQLSTGVFSSGLIGLYGGN